MPLIFDQAGILERLYTDSFVGNKPWLVAGLDAIPAALRPRLAERWLGRNEPRLSPDKVTSFEALGLAYARACRQAAGPTERLRVYLDFGARFQDAALQSGLADATAVYVMTGAAERIVSHATDRGLACVLEQFDHTMLWSTLLDKCEIDRWGSLSAADLLADVSELELARERESTAIRGADKVIVASDYTRRTMIQDGYSTDNVRIVPYGIDLGRWAPAEPLLGRMPGPLRVLFVASVDLRKGILYLLEALKRLGTSKIELRAAGAVGIDRALLSRYVDSSCFLGAVPRRHVQELFHWADIFVFPTLGEGFGMVQVEAIATGTPVIATTECGEVVREGREGHLVPPRDPDTIAHWLDHYAAHPARLEPLRSAALDRARDFSLEAYAERLLVAVSGHDQCESPALAR